MLGSTLPALLLLLPVFLSSCSREERAASALAAMEEAYAASELGLTERFAEFSLQYEAFSEKFSGTQASAKAGIWLETGTSESEEEAASAELAALEEAYSDSELDRTEKLEEFLPKYQALADEFWGTDAALEAELWVMGRSTRGLEDEEEIALVGETTDKIFERYSKSLHIERLGGLASSFSDEQLETYLGDLRENSPHPTVRAAAIFGPAKYKKTFMKYGRIEDTPETRDAIEADLQLIVAEYADVPLGSSTYGIMADALLNAYTDEDLAIGQPAPEIIGVTADGEEIRLSQFLGKVVVIDFWGDW